MGSPVQMASRHGHYCVEQGLAAACSVGDMDSEMLLAIGAVKLPQH
jgi:hypothetical protein